LLIRERFRRLNLHYGWIGYLSVGSVLLLFGSVGAAAASRHARDFAPARLEAVLTSLWATWVLLAVITGKDLSWKISLERTLIWPVRNFLRLYLLTFFLGFPSLPLLVLLVVAEVWTCLKWGAALSPLIATFLGVGLFAATVRLTASIARTALYGGGFLSGAMKWTTTLMAVSLAILFGASTFYPEARVLFPGHQFTLVLLGERPWSPLIGTAVYFGLLSLADCSIRRNLIYSGVRGPLAPQRWMLFGERLLTTHASWPGPLFRIALLGWLRSRNALMLFLWGFAYNFFFTYFSRPDEASYFYTFIWMNLLFFAYLRGNLLGLDRGASWLYYSFPARISAAIGAKNLSLNLLLACMFVSLLVAGGLKADPKIPGTAWCNISIYAASGLLFGELCGTFLSIRYPDPIERLGQFSGGTSTGALVVPVLNTIFLAAFLAASALTSRFLSPICYWGLLLAVPACLLAVRLFLVPSWVSRVMQDRGESILKKLSVISS